MGSYGYSKVILLGNLTRDPELRYTPSGTAVASFALAINHRYRASGGGEEPAPHGEGDKSKEYKEEVSFIDIVVFGKQGENCAEYLNKGRLALVEGRIRQNRWESPDGQKRSKIEVVANTVRFLPSGGESRGYSKDHSEEPPEEDHAKGPEEDIPF